MKLYIFLLFTAFFLPTIHAQECEDILAACEGYLNGQKGKDKFISDGQVYSAFLDREKAEFKTTLYGGSTYRIAASAGNEDDYVIFTVKDLQGNIIFTNKDHKNTPYWDFVIPVTLTVTIEAEFDLDKKVTGCAVLLIGFKQ
jgi:hypothetical protein